VLVWWGLSLVERLRRDSNEFELKLSAARFYNMRFGVASLVGFFGFARTTLRRYGQALRSGDPERIVQAFSGQGGPRRVTVEIEVYIRARYVSLRSGVRDYNRRIREEVQQRWSVTVSAERLRQVFRDEDRVQGWERRREGRGGSGTEAAAGANGGDTMGRMSFGEGGSRNRSLPEIGVMPLSQQDVPEGTQFCHHAGLVVLFPWLELVLSGWPANPSLVRQLFLQVLAGAVNHEQSKQINMWSLALLCGPVVHSAWYLRQLTDQVATARNTAEVLRRNLGLLGEPSSDR
jgi:hypothetical protein